ncbi:MAG: hypothetical protein ACJ8H8_35015 [Geminicoccaceae bacterium]
MALRLSPGATKLAAFCADEVAAAGPPCAELLAAIEEQARAMRECAAE